MALPHGTDGYYLSAVEDGGYPVEKALTVKHAPHPEKLSLESSSISQRFQGLLSISGLPW